MNELFDGFHSKDFLGSYIRKDIGKEALHIALFMMTRTLLSMSESATDTATPDAPPPVNHDATVLSIFTGKNSTPVQVELLKLLDELVDFIANLDWEECDN